MDGWMDGWMDTGDPVDAGSFNAFEFFVGFGVGVAFVVFGAANFAGFDALPARHRTHRPRRQHPVHTPVLIQFN